MPRSRRERGVPYRGRGFLRPFFHMRKNATEPRRQMIASTRGKTEYLTLLGGKKNSHIPDTPSTKSRTPKPAAYRPLNRNSGNARYGKIWRPMTRTSCACRRVMNWQYSTKRNTLRQPVLTEECGSGEEEDHAGDHEKAQHDPNSLYFFAVFFLKKHRNWWTMVICGYNIPMALHCKRCAPFV